jgi:hypothetical protein
MEELRMLIPIVAILSGVGIVSVLTWANVQKMRLKHGSGPGTAELHDRLARIENAIETMAVEVERISEGQRFTTRLLSERSGARTTTPPDA